MVEEMGRCDHSDETIVQMTNFRKEEIMGTVIHCTE